MKLDDEEMRTIILGLSAVLDDDRFWRYHPRVEKLLTKMLDELEMRTIVLGLTEVLDDDRFSRHHPRVERMLEELDTPPEETE